VPWRTRSPIVSALASGCSKDEGLEAALLGALVVPVELDRLVLDRPALDVDEGRTVGRDRDDLAVARELDHARLA
jgi:hypothetical protein